MVAVRTLGENDVDRVADLTVRAFGGDDAMRERVRLAFLHCPAMPHGLAYGVEVGGELVAKWQLLDLRVRLDGIALPAVGAHALVVDPRYDGQGLAHAMLRAGRESVAQQGYSLMIGLAQKGALYAAMGGATACAEYEWSLDPLSLSPNAGVAWRQATDADIPRLVELRNRAEEARNLSLVRTPRLWPWLDRVPTDIFLSDRGYVGVRFSADAIELREVGYDDASFVPDALDLLAALARERRVSRVVGHLPADHPIVRASRDLDATLVTKHSRRKGIMAGLVSAEAFVRAVTPVLEARHRRGAFAETSLELSLVVDGEAHALFLRGDGPLTRTASLAVSSGAFAQLVFGYRGLRSLRATTPGAFSGGDETAAALDEVFAEGHPFLSHTDRF